MYILYMIIFYISIPVGTWFSWLFFRLLWIKRFAVNSSSIILISGLNLIHLYFVLDSATAAWRGHCWPWLSAWTSAWKSEPSPAGPWCILRGSRCVSSQSTTSTTVNSSTMENTTTLRILWVSDNYYDHKNRCLDRTDKVVRYCYSHSYSILQSLRAYSLSHF